MLVARTEHVYARPSWDCAVCGQAWPCAIAKVELLEQYGRSRTALSIYLASCLHDAIDDAAAHGGRCPADLYDLMLGWIPARQGRPTGTAEDRGRSLPPEGR